MLTFTLCFLLANFGVSDEPEPKITYVGMVRSDRILITIRTGESIYGKQVPYEKKKGDRIEYHGHHRWIRRGSELIGTLVGKDGAIMYTPDRVVGRRIAREWLLNPKSYLVTCESDQSFGRRYPDAVHLKSKPTDLVRTAPWEFDSPVEHHVFLAMGEPLSVGKEYRVEFIGESLPAVTFTFDPAHLRSEAIHVSQIGFRPDDPAKIAFLSMWLGDGGGLDYPPGLPFLIVSDETDEPVFRGETRLSKSADDKTEDAYKRNYNGTDVYEMDFSEVSTPGKYRVVVEGIGCSFPFEIAPDVWRKAFIVSARGFYHQRSGIELGPPYTDFRRPRPFHPDDGVIVYHSETPLMDTGNGLNSEDSNFGNLVRGRTDRIVENAWGGYMDAGDWDRRIQHLIVSRLLIELAELNPEYFSDVPLNIPESTDDHLPDIVNEALFNLDCYRRMQTPEGGIRGGIESEEHPRHGEASWQESLTVMAYAPGVWSSYEYAGVAAQAAHWLRSRDPKLADVYQESAIRAMEWAERELPKREEYHHAVNDSRNLAAAELYRLTGEPRWHELFLKTTAYTDPKADMFVWQSHEQRHAAWVYLRTEHPVDPNIRQNCLNALLREADDRVESIERSGFRWAKYAWAPAAWGAFVRPDALSMVRSHVLTGDPKYLKGIVLACQTGAGANPNNICYTTGIGKRYPLHPLHIDSRISNQPAPPGLTVFGPLDPQRGTDWAQKLIDRTGYPRCEDWPAIEAYWDVFWYPAMCEFTVHHPMAETAYVWGYLASRR